MKFTKTLILCLNLTLLASPLMAEKKKGVKKERKSNLQ